MPRIGGGHDFCSRRKGLVPPQSPAAPAPPVGEPCGFAPGCACGAFDAFGHHDDIYFLISFLGRGSDHHGWRQLLGFVSWENVGKTKGLFCGIIGASEWGRGKNPQKGALCGRQIAAPTRDDGSAYGSRAAPPSRLWADGN